ncbi:mechanosensitive ion channel family protein [Sporosarcina sp. ITBMC105]
MDWNEWFTRYEVVHTGIALGVLLLFWLFRKVFAKYIFTLILKLSNKAPNSFFSTILLSFEKPFQWLVTIIGVYVAIGYFPYIDQKNLLFLHLIRSSIVIVIAWGFYNLTGATSSFFSGLNNRFNMRIDDILIPFISKALRFIIIVITLSIIAQEFGYNVSTFVAGLGIGGLAFALAAKDALAQFFGGVVIITEKPFTIGDWIYTPTVEGTVEDISFRSTKIRTFGQALVTVPNATLANEAITNWSKMGKRQVSFTIRVAPTTDKDALQRSIEDIRHILRSHEGVHQETIFVKFDEYKENGMNIMLYFFTKTTDWGAYLDIKEEVNYKILDILRAEEITFALPNTKLIVDEEAL